MHGGATVIRLVFLYEILIVLQLNEEFDGVPALPPKRPLAKVDPSFLVARQEALDDFLRRVVRHPDVGNSQVLLHFLGVETFASYSSHNSTPPAAAPGPTPGTILAPPVPVEPTL